MHLRLIIICLILIFSFICSCSPKQEKKQYTMPIIIPKIHGNVIDSSTYNHFQYNKAVYTSMMFNHTSIKDYKNERIYTHLNQSGDSIYVYNSKRKKETRIKLPFKFNMPISLMYFHNYDSIFIFFEREFKVELKNHDKIIDDFVMIDSSGKVINQYSLDNVPDIYNGQINPMIYLIRWENHGNMISGNTLFIPFAIYLPLTKDVRLKNIKMELLCAYDLAKKKPKMLKIQFPTKDIGKTYKEIVKMSINNYSIINSTKILYSFMYSSEIYRYDLEKDTSYMISSFSDFFFNNAKEDDTLSFSHNTDFMCPIYSKKRNVFLRLISVSNYKNYKKFFITQILDKNLNLIGYVFEDSVWTSPHLGCSGDIIVYNKTNEFLSHKIEIEDIQNFTIEEIENSFLIQKPISKNQAAFVLDFNRISLETRLQLYLQDMAVEENSKIVMISTDILCGNCIDFLMQELQNNQTRFKQKNIKYLFYGKNITSAVSIISAYRVKRDFFLIDDKQSYPSFFAKDEMTAYSLINYNAAKLELIQTDYSNLHEDFSRFVDR